MKTSPPSRATAPPAFFLDDLYGAKDFSGRDQAMLRIFPAMTRILPASAVETAALAIELEALSEDLDQRLAAALAKGPITDESYANAYRATSTRAERERQIDLIDHVGRNLDALVAKPFVGTTLKLMRQPARVAGLAGLQDFLEHGFEAFRRMKGADEFLATLRDREAAILNRLFFGEGGAFFAVAAAAFFSGKSVSSSCTIAFSIEPFIAFSRNPSDTERRRSLSLIASEPLTPGRWKFSTLPSQTPLQSNFRPRSALCARRRRAPPSAPARARA